MMARGGSASHSNRERRLVFVGGAIALLVLLTRTGWAAEDAYISFRVVDNFLSGYGLTWNPGERVQAYTDPLFVFLLIGGTWISGSVYWSSVAISMLLTIASYFFLMYERTISAVAVGTAILLSSKAFMDFSVSGLENPATHLGIAAFCWAYWRKRAPLLLTLIASVTAVNRLDSFLLFLPALLLVYHRAGWRAWRSGLLGLTPLIAWELFSLFYYGFPFPNTAYAKLNTGVSSGQLMQQGVRYLVNDCLLDKVTAGAILGGFVFGIWAGEWPLALGVLVSVLYVVRVGGDFMSARFLSAPLVLACAMIVRRTRLSWQVSIPLMAAILVTGLVNPRPTLTTTAHFGINDPAPLMDGIADERAVFYAGSGILRWQPGLLWPNFPWSQIGEQLRKSGQPVISVKPAGLIPYHAGPGVHIIDEGALGDTLLARLQPIPGELRPGHFFRALPPGYIETVATGRNQIRDPKLAEYYDHLNVIISGDLWSVRRTKEIIVMNLGGYDRLLPKRPI